MLSKEHSADVKPYSPPFSKALKMRRAYHRMSYLMYCVSRHKTLIHIVLFIYIQASPSGQAYIILYIYHTVSGHRWYIQASPSGQASMIFAVLSNELLFKYYYLFKFKFYAKVLRTMYLYISQILLKNKVWQKLQKFNQNCGNLTKFDPILSIY